MASLLSELDHKPAQRDPLREKLVRIAAPVAYEFVSTPQLACLPPICALISESGCGRESFELLCPLC